MKYILLIVALFIATTSYAARPDEMLPNPALEARARAISKDLRCPVCQNQSIDDSDADLAHDLRVLVRQRIEKGDTDAQVKQYLVDRYGDYVLLDPPFKKATVPLWLGPIAFLLCALIAARSFMKTKTAPSKNLSEQEKERLAQMLGDKE